MSDFPFQYTLFVVLAPLATVVALSVMGYARVRHTTPVTLALVWLMVAITGWLVFNTLELVSSIETMTVVWAKVSYLFITTTPVAWWAFALNYTGRTSWTEFPRFALFCVLPLLTTMLAWTNEAHHLLWTAYHFRPVGGLLALHVDHGIWFWVHLLYGYALMVLGAAMIVRQSFKSFQMYRWQSIWLAMGALIPVLANVVYILNLVPGLRKDYTPISFAVAGTAFAVGIFRYRLFDLKPVARDVVIDNMADPMLALDSQGRIVDLNPEAGRILEVAPDDVLGAPAAEVLGHRADFLERLEDVGETQMDIALELGGGVQHYNLRVSTLTDRQGRVLGRVLIGRDITERKRAELALRQRTTELEARNRELDAFAHTVAHDLKTPLTALVGYSQLLQRNIAKMSRDTTRQYLDIILRGSRKMSDIIDALLLLANVRMRAELTIAPLAMADIVAEVRARLGAMIEEADAEVTVPATWPVVLGHAPWVEEVWANYLSNALKYAGRPEEGVPPHVALGYDADPAEGQIRFWVRDNGPGLTEAQQARLFTSFTRLDQARAEGHGLGLSIVHRIIERLGGEVGVESTLGEGATFYFTLPVAETDEGFVEI